MIWLWRFLAGSRAARAIAGAVGGILALLAYGAAKKREGRQQAAAEAKMAALEAESRGHRGAIRAKEQITGGKTPAQILRENDGKWK